MKKKQVGGVPGNVLGMIGDLALKLQNGVITPGQFGRFLKKENPFIKGDFSEIFQDWQNFYHDFGINCDLSGIRIPNDPGGFDRVIIMAQGITPQVAFDFCHSEFNGKAWKWTDINLDGVVISDRTARDNVYAIRIRNRAEADEELKNLSADDLKKQNILGITLEERLIFELKYFKETGKHLDFQNWTLCADSRYSDGSIPGVGWDLNYGRLNVHWRSAGSARGLLRVRQVVSV